MEEKKISMGVVIGNGSQLESIQRRLDKICNYLGNRNCNYYVDGTKFIMEYNQEITKEDVVEINKIINNPEIVILWVVSTKEKFQEYELGIIYI
jgi:hypothetical protein